MQPLWNECPQRGWTVFASARGGCGEARLLGAGSTGGRKQPFACEWKSTLAPFKMRYMVWESPGPRPLRKTLLHYLVRVLALAVLIFGLLWLFD